MGWNIVDMPMKNGTVYSGIIIGEEPIGGFSSENETNGAWTIFVTVADVDACAKKAKAVGATILVEPVDMEGVGRMATILDPQGARIAMITYESMQK